MTLRVPSTRATIFLAVVLALLTVPAVAWALTSPKTTVDTPAEAAQEHGHLNIGGTASHRVGVAGVRLVVRNIDDNTYFNGRTWQSEFVRFDIPVHEPGATETRWSYTVPARKLTPGNYRARAFSYSVEGNGDGFGGDWNEFTYLGRYDPTLYDTEITAPADGAAVSPDSFSVSGIASSTEGVESVGVVVRNRETNRYWNAERAKWQASFVTVQAELSYTDGGTQAAWTVNVPAQHVEPGSYFARAWVRNGAGNGDPIGRGRTSFTVEPTVVTPPTPASTTTTTTSPAPTVAPTTAVPPTEPVPSSTTSTTAEKRTTTTAKETTTTEKVTTTTAKATTTTAKATTTTAKPTTSTTVDTSTRRPYAQGNVNWKLVASDDFNGTTLDDDMWEYGWWRLSDGNKYDRPVNNNETACYHTDQVTLSGGELNLSMRPTTAAENAAGVCQKKDGSPAYFVSGYATTRKRLQIQPGTYIETRMYMPGEGNVLYNWPAFWTSDIDKTFGQWPYAGEFDVAEILKGQPCGNYHYSTGVGGSHQQTGKRCSTVSANRWVVFGMKWNHDGTVEFYHDGEQVQDRGNGGDWTIDPLAIAGDFAINYSHNISLQHGMHDPSHPGYHEPTASNPLTVKFDYVDVYKL